MSKLSWIIICLLLVVRIISSQVKIPEGKYVRITTKLDNQPIFKGDVQEFRVSGLLIRLPVSIEVDYGDKLVIQGKIENKKLIEAKIININKGSGILINIRKKLIYFFESSLPRPHNSLVEGIVLGIKSNLSYEFKNSLLKTGTSHVVVASGMNITLVGSFLLTLLTLFVKRKIAIIFSLTGIWFYSLLSGLEAPIVRAAIMMSSVFVAQALGRVSQTWRNLLLTAGFMLFIKPVWLFDIGFLLSFASFASIILFEKAISNKLKFIPSLLKEDLSTSLAAQIGVAPIIYFTFGRVSLLSPLLNALVLWTVAPIMIVGGISALIAFLFPALARLLLYLSYPLTSWFVILVNLFSNLSDKLKI